MCLIGITWKDLFLREKHEIRISLWIERLKHHNQEEWNQHKPIYVINLIFISIFHILSSFFSSKPLDTHRPVPVEHSPTASPLLSQQAEPSGASSELSRGHSVQRRRWASDRRLSWPGWRLHEPCRVEERRRNWGKGREKMNVLFL